MQHTIYMYTKTVNKIQYMKTVKYLCTCSIHHEMQYTIYKYTYNHQITIYLVL